MVKSSAMITGDTRSLLALWSRSTTWAEQGVDWGGEATNDHWPATVSVSVGLTLQSTRCLEYKYIFWYQWSVARVMSSGYWCPDWLRIDHHQGELCYNLVIWKISIFYVFLKKLYRSMENRDILCIFCLFFFYRNMKIYILFRF